MMLRRVLPALLAAPVSLLSVMTAPAAAAPSARPAAAPAEAQRLRGWSGAVHVIARDEQPLPAYLDRLEATLLLEQAHGNVGPYTVSVVNSLEALTPAEQAADGGRGERVLLRGYVALASLAGPQAGRLASLYALGLAQVLGVKAEEAALTKELADNLAQMGGYATRQAERLLAAPGTGAAVERLELRVLLLLGRGRYGEVAGAVAALERGAGGPSPLLEAYRQGAQRLQRGKGAAEADAALIALERAGGGAGALAGWLQRRAAREGLVERLAVSLRQPGVPEAVRRGLPAAGRRGKGKGGEAPGAALLAESAVLGACERLLADEQGRQQPAALECALLQQEGLRSDWAARPFGAVAGAPPLRVTLLNLTRALGSLLGLPGRPPARDAVERGAALAEVSSLLPQAGLAAEEAAALTLLAQVAANRASGGQGVAPQLYPAIDKFLAAYPCSRLSLPLVHGRFAGDLPRRHQALRGALQRCGERAAQPPGLPEADEGQRLLALAVLGMDARDDGALRVLREVAGRHAGLGEGRFALALADGEALRLFETRGVQPSAAELAALQQRYEEARGRLTPWDGAEVLGRADAQVGAVLLWRVGRSSSAVASGTATAGSAATPAGSPATPAGSPGAAPSLGAVGAGGREADGLLTQAESRLRFARVLSGPEDAPRVQALEVHLSRERAAQRGDKLVASQARAEDLGRLPAGPLRRVLACELEQTARGAKEADAAAGFHKLAAGDPLPPLITLGQPRLSASLGSDERLRLVARSTGQVLLLPRCGM